MPGFSSRAPLLALVVALACIGCASSHTRIGVDPGTDGSVSSGDGGVVGRDGAVSRDGGPAPGDGGRTDGGFIGPDGGPLRDWVDLCVSTCRHVVDCGALGVDTVAMCTSNCTSGASSFGTPGCRDIAYQALTCLEGLSCPDLAGLTPDETFCAPYLARLNRMCGGG